MKLKISNLIFFITFLVMSVNVYGQKKQEPPFLNIPTPWADSVFNSLSEDERIAQLFMVAAYSNKDDKHKIEIEKLIRDYKIGGLIFFQGGPLRQARLSNLYQSQAQTPLLISMDAEWGLAMRLDSTVKFPRQMTLGAIQNDSLIYEMGREIARHIKRIGMQVNFAPVVDVNNNPNNPVINNRSFGEDRENVSDKGVAYMRGLQDENVLANAKHFPGHGDTDVDSHKGLPTIGYNRERLDSLELYPFKKMFDAGLGSVMVAHLSVPVLDSTPNFASTLSKPIVTGLLKEELGFKGLIFTDALNMQGVADYYAKGEVDALAAIAGNDVMLFAEDVPVAMQKIKEAIAKGEITMQDIDEKCMKILKVKEWSNLHQKSMVNLNNLHADLNTVNAMRLQRQLIEASLTVINNQNNILPLKKLNKLKIASIVVGDQRNNVFQQTLSKYTDIKNVELPKDPDAAAIKLARQEVEKNNLVIVSFHNTNNSPSRNFGVNSNVLKMVAELTKTKTVIVNLLGNPYAFKNFKELNKVDGVIISYQDDELTQSASAQLIMGAISANGKLPVSINSKFPVNTGIDIEHIGRLKYTDPTELGFHSNVFGVIDSIAIDGINKMAYPGCQILIAKDGKVIYNKNFGYHTYENTRPVRHEDLYDLASITKIAASTISLMKLQDEGKFSLNDDLSDYFPELEKSSPYYSVNLRKMMAHQAGLVPWIPFYSKTLIFGEPNPAIYSNLVSEQYPVRVAHDLFMSQSASDTLLLRLINTKLREDTEYKYSDLGYYFVREIVSRQSESRIDSFAAANFYTPMGLPTMGYLPLTRFDKNQIVPTEYDTYFRNQLIHGYVHDPGAAMQGGVGGHAGLFSNAQDLAALMQMLINKGHYGGENFLEPETIAEYTKCQFCKTQMDENRRGAGFDKPVMDGGPGPTCNCVTFDSFGHTGFTGTVAWADPVENIVYVFLSNRVYPTAQNNKLAEMDIRTNIQEEIYAILNHRVITAHPILKQ